MHEVTLNMVNADFFKRVHDALIFDVFGNGLQLHGLSNLGDGFYQGTVNGIADDIANEHAVYFNVVDAKIF